MAAFNASRLVCAAMPPMVWTMELISSDCLPSASMPSVADCTWSVIFCIVTRVSFTTLAPRSALTSVCSEMS